MQNQSFVQVGQVPELCPFRYRRGLLDEMQAFGRYTPNWKLVVRQSQGIGIQVNQGTNNTSKGTFQYKSQQNLLFKFIYGRTKS